MSCSWCRYCRPLWASLVCVAHVTLADSGDGIRLGPALMHPYLDLNAVWDSNVYRTPEDEIDDFFFEPEIGLRLGMSWKDEAWNLLAHAFYADREYVKETQRQFNSYGESLALRYRQDQRTYLEVLQSYRYLNDNDLHYADLDAARLPNTVKDDLNTLNFPRDSHRVGALASRRLTDKTELALAYQYSGVAYHEKSITEKVEDAAGSSAAQDLDIHAAQIEGALRLSDKTDAFLSLNQSWQYQEGTSGAADLSALMLGLKTAGTDKLTYRANGGIQKFSPPKSLEDESETLFVLQIIAEWFATEKISIRAGGGNGTQFSAIYQGNSINYLTVWTGLGYQWTDRWSLWLRGVYRQDDYRRPVPYEEALVDRRDHRYEAQLRAEYAAPGGFLNVYAQTTWDSVDSNIWRSTYDQIRFTVGAIARY